MTKRGSLGVAGAGVYCSGALNIVLLG